MKRLLVLILTVGLLTLMSATVWAAYNEAPMLADLVARGLLPPVEERLPHDPYVVEVVDEIGTYGGTYRGFQLGDADIWVVTKTVLHGPLVQRSYRTMWELSPTAMHGWSPGVATHWEWDEDARGITIFLREGVRWSDGHPFTADDIMFAWHDIQLNKDFQPDVPMTLKAGGEPISVTKIDDYTLRFEFQAPYAWFLDALYNTTKHSFSPLMAPKHYLSQYHPGFNPQATWEEFQAKRHATNVELPALAPWRWVRYNPAEEAFLERNPYYWAVDAAGNQLPYLDYARFRILGSQEAAILLGMAGEIDVAERNFQVLANLPLLRRNEAEGNYRINLWRGSNFTMGNEIWPNYDLQDPAYARLRELLRTPQFRNALSIALNRDSINDLMYLGMAKPANLGLGSHSVYWDDEMEEIAQINAEYDPARARQLLEDLGLADRNGDGWLQYPDGDRVTILLGAVAEFNAHVAFAELVADDWRAIGLDARVDAVTRHLLFKGIRELQFHAVVFGTQGVNFPPFFRIEGTFMAGYQHPDIVEDPPADLKQLWDMCDRFLQIADEAEAIAAFKEHQRLRAENNLGIWAATDIPMLGYVHNRMGNVPTQNVWIDSEDHIVLMPYQWFIRR